MHQIQKKLLEFLSFHSIEGLSLREIGEEIGVYHPQKVLHHLKQLEKKGHIRKEEKNDTYLVLQDPVQDIVYLPLYGLARCGHQELVDDGNVDKMPVSSLMFNIKNPKELFLVKAEGKSMYPKIDDGDLVIIRKQPQPDYQGQTCLVVHDSIAKIKNVIHNSSNHGSAVLLSINSDILPEEVKSDELTVHGVVKYIISRNKS